MRTFVTVLALAVLATTSAMAQGNQTFPNPDRDFWGEYFYSRVF